MLKFYDVDENYVRYLQSVDRQIPNVNYDTNNKFICGIVLNINNLNYYAPISSSVQVQRTTLPIFNRRMEIIATIRFSFMFPAPISVLTEKNFKQINVVDSKYADLLSVEHNYCLANESRILEKAKSIYAIGCNKNHKFNYVCCDFKLLEEKCIEYQIQIAQLEVAAKREK